MKRGRARGERRVVSIGKYGFLVLMPGDPAILFLCNLKNVNAVGFHKTNSLRLLVHLTG